MELRLFRRMPPPVPSLDGRLCLVTGAASGIGRATAFAAARRGARLVITDVNADLLDDVATELGDALVAKRAFDISDVDAVRAFADDVHEAHGPVDVVMNIAGIATWGPVEQLTHEQWRRTVDVDLMGPIHAIECFVPEMIRGGHGGQIANVSSAAGLLGLPWHAPYSAAKFGLRGISEVLRFDLERHKIGVTLVCPGGVDTPITQAVDIAGLERGATSNSPVAERFRKHAKSADHAAECILDGIVHNRYLVHTSGDIRALFLLQRVFPRGYEAAMRVGNRRFVSVLERLAGSGQAAQRAR
jgi:NAD(P)-dependent dehydrogenase (short-subunit alcohol dehydrogenase family)